MKKFFKCFLILLALLFCNFQYSHASLEDDATQILGYTFNNDLNNAEYLTQQFITKYPNSSDGYYLQGLIQHHKGNVINAFNLYTKSILVNNFSSFSKGNAYMNRGIIFWDNKKDKTSALKDYDNAIKFFTSDSTIYNDIYRAYVQRGELKTEMNSPVSAQADLEKSLSYNIQDKKAYGEPMAYLSKALYMQGKYKESMDYAVKAENLLGIGSDYPSITAQVYVAKSAYALKNYELAKSSAQMTKLMLDSSGMKSQYQLYYTEVLKIINF